MCDLKVKEQAIKVATITTNILDREKKEIFIEEETIVNLEVLVQMLEGIAFNTSVDTNVKDCMMLVIAKLKSEINTLEQLQRDFYKQKSEQAEVIKAVKECFDILISAI